MRGGSCARVNRMEVGEAHLALAVEDREDVVVARPGRF